MTVAELIAELQKHPPAKAVHVVLTHAYFADESGESDITLCDEDALPARDVINEGPYILIRSE